MNRTEVWRQRYTVVKGVERGATEVFLGRKRRVNGRLDPGKQILTYRIPPSSMEQITGGRNGYGAKLANIFSSEFTVETCDGSRQKKCAAPPPSPRCPSPPGPPLPPPSLLLLLMTCSPSSLLVFLFLSLPILLLLLFLFLLLPLPPLLLIPFLLLLPFLLLAAPLNCPSPYPDAFRCPPPPPPLAVPAAGTSRPSRPT